MRADQLTEVITYHGEGPVWDPAVGALRCVDMLAGAVVTVSESGAVDRLDVGSPVAAVCRPRIAGGLVVAVERGFRLVEPDGTLGEIGTVFDDPTIRMNEGACDPQGRFYCGSMAYDTRPGAGTLWRLDPDGTTAAVLDGVTISNGLVWALDGSRAYYIDTPTGRVDALTFDGSGNVVGRTPLFEVRSTTGSPDGMTIDVEGGLWVALWGGHAVHRYDPDGTLTQVLEVGPAQVTACTFGGPDHDRLYVTTSREGLADGADPSAGAVFVAAVGTRGRPALPFAG